LIVQYAFSLGQQFMSVDKCKAVRHRSGSIRSIFNNAEIYKRSFC